MIFTKAEIEKINHIAKGRQKRAYMYNRKPKYGQKIENTINDNLLGVIGEFAVAKHFCIDYDGNGEMPDDFDVGEIQIRTTYYHTGGLIMNRPDPLNRIYLLVYANIVEYEAELKGWAYGYDIKKQENWRELGKNRYCYYLSQEKLEPISHLYKMGNTIYGELR